MAIGDLVVIHKIDALDNPYTVLGRVVNVGGAVAELIGLTDDGVAALVAALPSGGGGAAEDITFDDTPTPNLVDLFGADIENVQQLGEATEAGLVTLSDDVQTRISSDVGTVKGDLLVYDGSAFIALPVGNPGQILSADPGEATGLLWVDP